MVALKHKKVSPEELKAIKAKNYSVFNNAVENGCLKTVQSLRKKMSLKEFQKMIRADNYDSLILAAEKGHLEILDYVVQEAPDELLPMIKNRDYFLFQVASGKGRLKVLNYLEKKVSKDELQNMIKASGYMAFIWASGGGHLDTLHYLVDKSSQETVQEMIKADNYEAYCSASHKGCLSILEYLEKQAPDKVIEMVQVRDFKAFRTSSPDGANYLLRYGVVFDYAETHDHEYSHHIRPYIDNLLKDLRNQKSQFEETELNNVFDVTAEQANIYFYCIRNLIRRGSPAPRDELLLLLGIPAVKALVHTSITANRPNELLRLALSSQNIEAANLLLTIPAVLQLAEANNYYRDELQDGIDVGTLARDHESSMVALAPGEQKRLEKAQKLYKTELEPQKIPALMDELRATLQSRYNKNPACIKIKDKVIELPLEWDDFQNLSLKEDERNLALKAYYQHIDHTAFRYLSIPNFWMHDEAAYVNVDIDDHSQKWSTFDEYQPLIALLYVAAKDEAMPATEGFTIATRFNHFVDELAHLGRAHNWDNSRAKGNNTEEYDDLEGDKPSCFSGVKRRLFQSVVGHPLLTLLTAEGVKQEVRSFAREHFKARINLQNCQVLKAAWDNVCDGEALTEAQLAVLKELDIPTEQQEAFLKQLEVKYSEQFRDDPRLKQQAQQAFVLKTFETNHACSSAFASTQWQQFVELSLGHVKFLELLRDLKAKQNDYLIYYPTANAKAKTILAGIKEKADAFYRIGRPSKKEVQEFKEDCIGLVQQNSAELQEHRVVLGAFFAAIKQFFVALMAVLFHAPSRYAFFDARPDSAKILGNLEQRINRVSIGVH